MPYFRSIPAVPFTSFAKGATALRSVLTSAIAYGLISKLRPSSGASMPTMAAASEACAMAASPRAAGTGFRNDRSFFDCTLRISWKPQTWSRPGR